MVAKKLLLSLLLSQGYSLIFRDNGYEDLLVGISPDISQENGHQIIAGIKSWVTSGSSTLYKSSRGWARIRSVVILLPATWTQFAANTTDKFLFEDAEVRVDIPNPVHGDTPHTAHQGGCGDQGQFIQVTEKFVTEIEGDSSDTFGPPGNVFVHEWSKYRYGVFEEYGYPGDPLYPMFYYRTTWTAEGQQNILTPNFCTDKEIKGTMSDISGGDCITDMNGIPDSNCVFVGDKNQPVISSIMAAPYIANNTEYCDMTETRLHHPGIPTRHNALCGGKSVWEVVKNHPDFVDYDQGSLPSIDTTVPTVSVVRPNTPSFVFVLDVSGSMEDFDRIVRLRQAVKRWLRYDVADGVLVGIVSFADRGKIRTVTPLTEIDETSRTNMITAVSGLNAKGGTCLDLGLLRGKKVLEDGGLMSGGVIIFLTDGIQAYCDGNNERPGWGPEGGIPGVIDQIAESGIRVITIAFGPNAQTDIETLAERTHGKAYSVPDNTGPGDINDPLSGSLTYQPAVPAGEMELLVLQQSYENVKEFTTRFTIDRFLGGDMKIQVDVGPDSVDKTIGMLWLEGGNATLNKTLKIDPNGVYQWYMPEDSLDAEVMTGDLVIQVKLNIKIDFLALKILSKPGRDTLPLRTRCWTSAGSETVSVSNGGLLYILAEVKQGNSPVIGARVIAYIERAGMGAPVELELLDGGAVPDQVGDDGVYARYFTGFDKDDRYSVKCQVEGTNQTNINQGFIDAKREKSLPSTPSATTPMCCGSSAVNEDSKLDPTGVFSRTTIAGSFQVTGVPDDNTNIYPPGVVRDFHLLLDTDTLVMTFTAPGDDLDHGTARGYTVYYSQNKTEVEDPSMINNTTCYIIEETDLVDNTTLNPIAAGLPVTVHVDLTILEQEKQYFFRLFVQDRGDLSSWSNIASVYNHVETPDQSATNLPLPGLVMLIIFSVTAVLVQ